MIVAAIDQWTKVPNAWPLARTALGKTSEMNTNMTAPCERAKKAMEPTSAPRTSQPFTAAAAENAQASKAKHSAIPTDPISRRIRRPKRSMMNMATTVNSEQRQADGNRLPQGGIVAGHRRWRKSSARSRGWR